MPLIFPSHQGFVLPVWRKWPTRFDVAALCIGAAMPDVIDGLAGIYQGYLGQGYGHTLAGLFALCLPGGLILTRLTNTFGKRILNLPLLKQVAPTWARWFEHPAGSSNPPSAPSSQSRPFLLLSFSVGIGAFSHLLFDLISHGSFVWFYPWYQNDQLFPTWWYARWAELPLPFFRAPYPLGPHLLVWIVLSIVGAILFSRLSARD